MMRGMHFLSERWLFVAFLVASITIAPDVEASKKDKSTKSKKSDVAVETVVVQEIVVSGNSVTKERIILKELTFKLSDTLNFAQLPMLVEDSRNNLLNTSLFNFVYIDHVLHPNKTITIYVKVEERWYLWAFPIFEQADRNVSSFIKNGNWDMMNYGVFLRRDNFRGRQETLKFRVRVGYSNQLTMSFQSPEYKGKFGWGFLFDYNMYDHLAVSTNNDQLLYLKSAGKNLYQTTQNQLYLNFRHNLYLRHQLSINYRYGAVADTVRTYNQNFLGNNGRSIGYVEMAYTFSNDTRDSRIYPLKGSLQSITLTKYGMGLSKRDLNYADAKARMFVYQPLAPRFYWGTELTGVLGSNSNIPYFNRSGIGYRDFISGYEYYVAEGPSFALAKNRLLFELIPTKVKQFDFIPFNKFSKIHYALYMRAFYDGGYVWNDKAASSNKLLNNYIFGYGAGFDFVTFYDKAFSLYYALNKSGQGGVFVHLHFKI